MFESWSGMDCKIIVHWNQQHAITVVQWFPWVFSMFLLLNKLSLQSPQQPVTPSHHSSPIPICVFLNLYLGSSWRSAAQWPKDIEGWQLLHQATFIFNKVDQWHPDQEATKDDEDCQEEHGPTSQLLQAIKVSLENTQPPKNMVAILMHKQICVKSIKSIPVCVLSSAPC